MSKSLLIYVVSYFDEIHRGLWHGVQDALGNLVSAGWSVAMNEHVGNADLGRARNAVLAQFLAMPQVSDLLFLDADISWAPGSLERLVSHDVDLVAGVYPQRYDNGGFPPRYLPGPLTPIDPATGAPTTKVVTIAGVDYPDGLVEVEGVPAGFMRIRRPAAERMAAYYGDTWYWEPLVTPTKGDNCGKAWQLFEFGVVDRGRWSEDLLFCRKYREAGGRVWVDPLISLHHHGRKTFSGMFGNWLRDKSLTPSNSLPGTLSPAVAFKGVAEAAEALEASAAKAREDRAAFQKAFGPA